MQMTANGYSAPTAYDFDLAVMALARVIEARSEETDDVLQTARKTPAGHVWVPKRRYQLSTLLTPPKDGETDHDHDDAPPLPALSFLPTADL
jgi:hypothetical protein